MTRTEAITVARTVNDLLESDVDVMQRHQLRDSLRRLLYLIKHWPRLPNAPWQAESIKARVDRIRMDLLLQEHTHD